MRRTCIKLVAAVLCISFFATMAFACSAKSGLVGTWESGDGISPYGFPESMEFFSDGTCVVDGYSGQYIAEAGRLKISALWAVLVFDFKLSGDKLTLTDAYDTATYVKSGSRVLGAKPDASEQGMLDSEPSSIAEPTLSPREEMERAIQNETASINEQLSEYDNVGDVKGALSYLIEQLALLGVTYPGASFDTLEQRKAAYMDDYRDQVLLEAKDVYEIDGYEAALNVLEDARILLQEEDESLISAIEYYKSLGPQLLIDMEYFNRSDSENAYTRVDSAMDNESKEYTNPLRLMYTCNENYWETYRINGDYSHFTGTIFIDYEYRASKTSCCVKIYGDDNLLYTSPKMTGGVLPEDFSIDISNVVELKIEINGTWASDYNWLTLYLGDGLLLR